jgi:hypothetical protein
MELASCARLDTAIMSALDFVLIYGTIPLLVLMFIGGSRAWRPASGNSRCCRS